MRSKGRHKKAIIVLLAVIMLGIGGCGTKNAAPAPDVSKLELTGRNEKTTAVFEYLRDNFGKKMLSAQQESTWTNFQSLNEELVGEIK